MANLTADKKIEQFRSDLQVLRNDRAASGTYYVGTVVMQGGDDGLVKPVSGSDVAGTVVVGRVTEQQTVDNDGDGLDYVAGYHAFSGDGFGAAGKMNTIAWFEDDTVAYSAQGTNRITGGRFRGTLSGSNTGEDIIIELGLEVSSSV